PGALRLRQGARAARRVQGRGHGGGDRQGPLRRREALRDRRQGPRGRARKRPGVLQPVPRNSGGVMTAALVLALLATGPFAVKSLGLSPPADWEHTTDDGTDKWIAK